MSVNGLQVSSVDFQKFVEFADQNSKASGKSLIKLQGSGDRPIAIKSVQDDTIGGFGGGWFRNIGQQDVNNYIRNAFLQSVLKRCGVEDASRLPPGVKKAMALSDYNGIFGSAKSLTGAGGSTTGKPLSLRRIRTVVQAVKDYEDSRMKDLQSCLESFNYKGFAKDIVPKMIARLAPYFGAAEGNADEAPLHLLGTAKLCALALRTCLNSVPAFKTYFGTDPNGEKRSAIEQYANSGKDISHKIAKELMEMLKVDDCVKQTSEILKMKADKARIDAMDKMDAKQLVTFLKTAFAHPASKELNDARNLANAYFTQHLGPTLLHDKASTLIMRKYTGNCFISNEGGNYKTVSWANILLETIQQTVLVKMLKRGEGDKYNTAINNLLKE